MRFFLLLILFISCNRVQKKHEKKVRDYYRKSGKVSRYKGQFQFHFPATKVLPKPVYPFSRLNRYGHRFITKEHFRCKGSGGSSATAKGTLFDCNGLCSHSLLVKDGKEYVYQEFLDLFNGLQEILQEKLVILEAHRCPKHNAFCNPSVKNSFSKHQVGGLVTLQVCNIPNQDVVDAIRQYYEDRGETLRARGENKWANRYVRVHLGKVLAVELLFDRETTQRVEYSYKKAHKSLFYY